MLIQSQSQLMLNTRARTEPHLRLLYLDGGRCKHTVHVRPGLVHSCRRYDSRKGQRLLQSQAGSDAAAEQFAASPAAEDFSSAEWKRRTLGNILKFAAPALTIPLADPLQSLLDSLVLGHNVGSSPEVPVVRGGASSPAPLSTAALELAGLGYNIVLFNAWTYVILALSVATNSVVAQRFYSGDEAGAASALGASLLLAAGLGTAVLVILQVWGPSLLRLSGCTEAVLQPALGYLRVRAWAAPFVLLTMVAQAGLLAQGDSVTPGVVVMLQSLFNGVGDLVLVRLLPSGLVATAWATMVAQVLGTLGLLAALWRSKARPVLQLPSRADLADIGGMYGPATFLYVAKQVCYIVLVRTANSTLGLLELAAHQLLFQTWNIGAFGFVPMEQAALVFVPRGRSAAERSAVVALLLRTALGLGALLAAFCCGLPRLAPGLFTSDPALWPGLRSVTLLGTSAMLCCSLEVASSGILVASREIRYLVTAMTTNVAVIALFCYVQVRQGTWGLQGVWAGLLLFFLLRAVQSTHRVWKLYLRPPSVAPVQAPVQKGTG